MMIALPKDRPTAQHRQSPFHVSRCVQLPLVLLKEALQWTLEDTEKNPKNVIRTKISQFCLAFASNLDMWLLNEEFFT